MHIRSLAIFVILKLRSEWCRWTAGGEYPVGLYEDTDRTCSLPTNHPTPTEYHSDGNSNITLNKEATTQTNCWLYLLSFILLQFKLGIIHFEHSWNTLSLPIEKRVFLETFVLCIKVYRKENILEEDLGERFQAKRQIKSWPDVTTWVCKKLRLLRLKWRHFLLIWLITQKKISFAYFHIL